jgi:hypothetical protein
MGCDRFVCEVAVVVVDHRNAPAERAGHCRPWIASRVGEHGHAAVIDRLWAQFVVAGFVAADLAQPGDR